MKNNESQAAVGWRDGKKIDDTNYAHGQVTNILPKRFAKAPRARWGTRRMPTVMMLFAALIDLPNYR